MTEVTAKKKAPDHSPGALLIVLSAVLWSTGGLGIKSLAFHPLVITGWRSLFALPVLLLSRDLRNSRPAILKQPYVLATALAYALTLCFFVAATRLTTAANAILLQYTCPAWVILVSLPVLQERPHRRDYLAAGGCLAGLVFFFLDELTLQGLLGNVLAVASGLTMACLTVSLRVQGLRGQHSSAIASVVLGNILCVAIGLPWMLSGAAAFGTREWAILAALGSVQLAAPYIMFTAGLRHVAAFRATLLSFIEPVLNPTWVMLGHGEVPGPGAILGGVVILTSLLLDALMRRKLPRKSRVGLAPNS